MYANDEDQILQTALRLLRFHQIWHKDREHINSKMEYLKITLITSFTLVSLYGVIGHIFYTIYHPESLIVVDTIEDAIVIGVNLVVYGQVYALIVNRVETQNLLERLSDYRRFGKPPKLDAANEWTNKFSRGFCAYVVMGATSSSMMAVVERNECIKIHADLNKERICGFMEPVWVPFNISSGPNYWLFVAITTVSAGFLLNSGATVMSLIYGLNEIYITLIDHLNEEILRIGDDYRTASAKIKFCVDYHNELIDICKTLNNCWGKLMLMHQILVTGLLSLIGIQCLLEPNLKSVAHGMGWLISLTIPCYSGQRLLDKSMEIPLTLYSSKWYSLLNKDQKNFIFMIQKANIYLALEKDGYGLMNLATVGSVVNNIYSLLTLLSRSMQTGIERDKSAQINSH